jgi:hypothetical protein
VWAFLCPWLLVALVIAFVRQIHRRHRGPWQQKKIFLSFHVLVALVPPMRKARAQIHLDVQLVNTDIVDQRIEKVGNQRQIMKFSLCSFVVLFATFLGLTMMVTTPVALHQGIPVAVQKPNTSQNNLLVPFCCVEDLAHRSLGLVIDFRFGIVNAVVCTKLTIECEYCPLFNDGLYNQRPCHDGIDCQSRALWVEGGNDVLPLITMQEGHLVKEKKMAVC